ncbi:hypothetical protein ACQJBY_070447 [Aegilops geniculata]
MHHCRPLCMAVWCLSTRDGFTHTEEAFLRYYGDKHTSFWVHGATSKLGCPVLLIDQFIMVLKFLHYDLLIDRITIYTFGGSATVRSLSYIFHYFHLPLLYSLYCLFDLLRLIHVHPV